jgi:hypothetical protein
MAYTTYMPQSATPYSLPTSTGAKSEWTAMTIVAALFVDKNGPYYGLSDVDPWPEERDARLYRGPHPVVAHPPCERWGRYWGGGPMLHGTPKQKKLGDDSGCFEAALSSVRKWSGVIEHPEGSHAFRHFGLALPPKSGGWTEEDEYGGTTCCVEQGHYGHRARKATWLYVVGTLTRPTLIWGPSAGKERLDSGFNSKEHRAIAMNDPEYRPRRVLSSKDRLWTPIPFRDLLIGIARAQHASTPTESAPASV